jgi:hypothetical protein
VAGFPVYRQQLVPARQKRLNILNTIEKNPSLAAHPGCAAQQILCILSMNSMKSIEKRTVSIS